MASGQMGILTFLGEVQLLHLLIPLLDEYQLMPALCVVFQQRNIWDRLGEKSSSKLWIYRALLFFTAEDLQAHAASISQTRCRWNCEVESRLMRCLQLLGTLGAMNTGKWKVNLTANVCSSVWGHREQDLHHWHLLPGSFDAWVPHVSDNPTRF